MLRWRETVRVGEAVCSVALPLPDVLPLTRVVSGAATHAPRDGFQTEQNVLFMTAYRRGRRLLAASQPVCN
ncbi:hypothetical protein D3C71_1760420 [compost metagenome]